MVWTRTDRPSRVMFEVSSTENFANATRLAPLDTSPASDFTVKRLLTDLASDQDIFYRMTPGRATRPARAGASTRPA
jgi:alkaline phosphatase D